MFKHLYVISSAIVTVFGLISIPLVVYQVTESAQLAIGVSAAITLVLTAPPLLAWMIRPGVFAEFGIGRASSALCIQSCHLLDVQENGDGEWSISRKLVFLKEPERKDLRDLFEMDQPFPPEDIRYVSSTSREIERVHVKKNRIAIFWSPKTRIFPFQPYEHSFQWMAKTSHADPGNYKTTIIDLNTGYHRSIVKTPYPLGYVMAFKKPRWKRLRREGDVYRYALQCKTFGCPQPRMTSPHSFEWEIRSPEFGRTYFCIFFRKGGVEHWQTQIPERRWISRIFKSLRQ